MELEGRVARLEQQVAVLEQRAPSVPMENVPQKSGILNSLSSLIPFKGGSRRKSRRSKKSRKSRR